MDAEDCVDVGYWTRLEDGRIECRLCPRFCKMRPGQRGLCFVRRAREDGEGMELTGYGRSTGFCVDPIEKKPLNHFLPGSAVLSFALKLLWPALPFMDRVGLVFLACLALAVVLSLLQTRREPALRVELKHIDYSTSAGFNLAALVVTAILIALYATWW